MAPIDRIAADIFQRAPGFDPYRLEGPPFVIGGDAFAIRLAVIGSDRKNAKGRPYGNLVWPIRAPIDFDAAVLVDVVEGEGGSSFGWASRVMLEHGRKTAALRMVDRGRLRRMSDLPNFIPFRLIWSETGSVAQVYQEDHGMIGGVYRATYAGLQTGEWFDGWANDRQDGIFHRDALAECAECVVADWSRRTGHRQHLGPSGGVESPDLSESTSGDGVAASG
ncbi:MAG TPA: hypothetical protein VFX03_13570 [Thermomicrobiales bacterium]|nr:hypothetical protein [Thermomicrobiales bacterium]